MLGSFTLFEVRGVPIRVHFTTVFMLPMINRQVDSVGLTLLFVVILLTSVALHELGHTLVAQRYGIPVKDIILTPIGGVARMMRNPDNPHHEIRIALAGPMVSLLLAALFALLSTATQAWGFVSVVAKVAAGLNTMLLLFNLLPSFPMDGGRVLRGWLVPRKGLLEATRIASEIGRFLAIAFIVFGLIRGNYSLALIGGFILMAAGAEYRMMQLQTAREPYAGRSGFEAGPPPYEEAKPRRDGLWNDLIQTARDLYNEVCRVCFKD